MLNLSKLFDEYNDDFLKFERVNAPRTKRRALHAFLLLDELVPGDSDIVSAAEHDEIWLSVEPEHLAAVATEEQIVELIRCGIRYDKDNDALAMFV